MNPEEFYAACNLTENPFRSNPSSAADPRADIWVGYEAQQRQLRKFLTRTRADQVGNSNFVMLYGGYGTGKSHALLWAQNLILHAEKEAFKACCYFVPTLRKDKGILSFGSAYCDDIIEKSSFLNDVIEYREYLGTLIYGYKEAKELGPEITQDAVLAQMIPSVELYNFAKEIMATAPEELHHLVAPAKINDYEAMLNFTRIINLFVHEIDIEGDKKRFKSAAYLFIDELDDLLRSSVKEARMINDIIRRIIEACPNCFTLVIALSAEIAELPAIFEDYILSRIHRQIEMHLLDKQDAVKFVAAILDKSRADPSGLKGYFPFSADAIDAVVANLVEITPRKIVNTMQQVIEEVRLSGFDPSDGEVTSEVLDDADVMEEILGHGGVG